MAIGLPVIDITFKKLAATIVQRSAAGIVALIIKDDTDPAHAVKEYTSQLSIDKTKFTAANLEFIKDVFGGGAAKVIVLPVSSASESTVAEAVSKLGTRKYNWIGLADGSNEEQTDLSAYIKEQETAKKSVKAVVFQAGSPDCQHVVNFTTNTITYTDCTSISGRDFVPRLLGLLAGLPLTRSSTGYEFDDLLSVEEPESVDSAINKGEFVLYNDEGIVRVARGVNSLVTTSPTISDDFKKILIVETLDQIRDDIRTAFKNDYLGKYRNKYDYQVLFISAINSYFDELEDDDYLDNTYDNIAQVDVESQRAAWTAAGKTEAAEWDEQTVRNNSFGSKIFLSGSIKVPDAMEDLSFAIELE